MDDINNGADWQAIDWSALQHWAGATTAARGWDYQRAGRVRDLARTATGALIAWVHGSARYATRVGLNEQGLLSTCTCPYGARCKHAVAVVLDHLAAAQQGRDLPTASANDSRLVLLDNPVAAWAHDEDEEAGTPTGAATPTALRTFLAAQAPTTLIDLVVELADQFPEIGRALAARHALASGRVDGLVGEVRALIAEATATPQWDDRWDDRGATPDYREVQERLALLLHQGYADAVVALGEELLTAGSEQSEQTDDEGESGMELVSCLTIVFDALGQSTFPPAEQLHRAVMLHLRDEYDLCSGSDVFWNRPFPADAWSDLADTLLAELPAQPGSPGKVDFARAYRREQRSDWAIRALQHADRQTDVFALAEREAEQNGSYVRLVRLLVEAGRTPEAEQWIARGIVALAAAAPGLVVQLRTIQREIWERAGNWPLVAAWHADHFFQQPGLLTFNALHAAAEQADVWTAVRSAALHYLETGELPTHTARIVGDQIIPPWPLPATDLPEPLPRWVPPFPALALLIVIAAEERRPDEVLRWYDRRSSVPVVQCAVDEGLVADAVAEDYPERAIPLWQALAEAAIAQTKPAAYLVAGDYLLKLRRAYVRLDRLAEWQGYVARLRQTNLRKRRLVEVLDRLVVGQARAQ